MQYKFIKESVGEYEDYDKIIKNYFTGRFKLWWHNTKMYFRGFQSLIELPKETNLVKHVLKGLDIKVFAYPDSDRNAFVIPGYYIGCEKEYPKLYREYYTRYRKHNKFYGSFFQMLLSKQLDQFIKMRKFAIVNDSKIKGKKCAVFKDITTPISIFVTYGMLNDATPDQRIGIYLHEIGHWIDTAKSLPEMMVENPEKESCYLYYVTYLQRYITRYQELNADKFAKTLGYGQELSSALDQIVSVRKQASWIYKVGDWMMKCAVKNMNDEEEHGMSNPMNYPSMETRKKYLGD